MPKSRVRVRAANPKKATVGTAGSYVMTGAVMLMAALVIFAIIWAATGKGGIDHAQE